MRLASSTSPAGRYRLDSECATKGTSGNSAFSRTWASRNGELKFANTIAIHRIQNRFILFLRADFRIIETGEKDRCPAPHTTHRKLVVPPVHCHHRSLVPKWKLKGDSE